MTAVKSLRGLASYFRSLVHESARDDAVMAARHYTFIASHLTGGFIALAVFPVYLAFVGRPGTLSALAFVWFLSPIAIALFLSRSGRLAAAHIISAANLAGVVTLAAALTGGLSSFVIAWMVVVPLEAALSINRRVVVGSMAVAASGLLALWLVDHLGLLPQAVTLSQEPHVLALLGAMSALIYAGGLAISVQAVHTQSEQAVRRGESRYRLLAENATDVITRHDADGKVVFASIASQRIFGVPAKALMGDGLFQRVHVGDRPAYLAALDRCLAGVEVSVEFRARAAKDPHGSSGSDGDRFIWMEMRCRSVITDGPAGGGEPAAAEIVAVTRDIMDRKTHEDEVLKARDLAETANRAKTQFLANMSHELRTPLNAIIGFSEILTRELFGGLGDERYGEYARLIHESGEHLLNVVNEILDMSKIEAGKFSIVAEPFDAGALVKSCCQIMSHQAAKKELQLVTRVADGLPELVADKRACKQILLNLLSNAIKFTKAGGQVAVSVRCDGETMAFCVKDNGIGIAADDLPKLGNPFIQADSSYDRHYEGSGLGLSLVKGLARLHGGSMDIESEIGKGTTVTIRLPVEGSGESAADCATRVDAA